MNINSIRNKFEIIAETIANFDIFLISELRLDATFPKVQFKINGCQIIRGDCNSFGRGLMFYLNENIPCKLLNNHTVDTNIEIIATDFHQIKWKWFLLGIYNLPGQSALDFINAIINVLNHFSHKYENFHIIGDFNMTVQNIGLHSFLQLYDLSTLIDTQTCYQL